MGVFYTGKGDKGKSFVGKLKIDKTSDSIEALGDLDELNSLLGVVGSSAFAKASADRLVFNKIIGDVQENLFIIQANAAGFMQPKFRPPEFKESKIKELENLIDDFEREIKPALKFIVPGTTKESAWLDYARAVSRRVERSVIRHSKRHSLNPSILSYMNRLSSLFFAMARMVVVKNKKKERYPRYK